jgi:hypothetical protein
MSVNRGIHQSVGLSVLILIEAKKPTLWPSNAKNFARMTSTTECKIRVSAIRPDVQAFQTLPKEHWLMV